MRLLSLWAPPLGVMAVIFYLSSLSDPGAPPGGLSDKVLHFLVYAALGATLLRALADGRAARVTLRTAALAIVLATLYGVSDEVHQSFVPERTPDARDVAADLGGASGGALFAVAVARLVNRRNGGRPSLSL